MPELAAYQDAAYAAAYAEFVERVRAREARRSPAATCWPGRWPRNLFKLAAYKDEYEVARLSLDPALTGGSPSSSARGARYAYRLHPPVLRSLGMQRKISLGPWFRPAFRTLVAMRRLRGTPFDPFGRTEVRREERALLGRVPRRDHPAGRAASPPATTPWRSRSPALPDLVRGYEEIKLGNVAAYRARMAELLAAFGAEGEPSSTSSHSGSVR